ncbi:invasion associated locus B family protein [Mesorhizobium sp.]|uniref:invasion associated locus B family protein n=1 Tax=Mesorhizobium sp. TaxID=1871066 RepID=UPI00345B2E26
MLAVAGIVGPPAFAAQNKGDKVAAQPAGAAAKPQLPGGASALSETHGDWTVNCQVTGTNKVCSLSHQQFNKQSGQRLLAIELTTKTGKDAAGTLALPFGLALANGVALEIDDKKLDGTLQFSTCQAVGCLGSGDIRRRHHAAAAERHHAQDQRYRRGHHAADLLHHLAQRFWKRAGADGGSVGGLIHNEGIHFEAIGESRSPYSFPSTSRKRYPTPVSVMM